LQGNRRKLLKESLQNRSGLQLLARSDDLSQRRWPAGGDIGDFRQLLQRHKRKKNSFYFLVSDHLPQLERITPCIIAQQYQTTAGTPGRKYLLEGNIETHRGELYGPERLATERIQPLPVHQIGECALHHSYTFGLAG